MFANKPLTETENLINDIRNDRVVTAIFDNTQMTSQDVRKLALALSTSKKLETLSLLNCSLKGEDVIKLADAIKNNFVLTTVSIEKFQDDSADVAKARRLIGEYVKRNENMADSNSIIVPPCGN